MKNKSIIISLNNFEFNKKIEVKEVSNKSNNFDLITGKKLLNSNVGNDIQSDKILNNNKLINEINLKSIDKIINKRIVITNTKFFTKEESKCITRPY